MPVGAKEAKRRRRIAGKLMIFVFVADSGNLIIAFLVSLSASSLTLIFIKFSGLVLP